MKVLNHWQFTLYNVQCIKHMMKNVYKVIFKCIDMVILHYITPKHNHIIITFITFITLTKFYYSKSWANTFQAVRAKKLKKCCAIETRYEICKHYLNGLILFQTKDSHSSWNGVEKLYRLLFTKTAVEHAV